jgi:hypothetical protein
MRLEPLRLDEVLRRDVSIAWHEGVAVIQGVCRTLTDAGNVGAHFPLAAEIAIDPEGKVSLLRSPSGSPGVMAAGRLLGEMLQADVPVRLRLIHSDAMATAPVFHSVRDLSSALEYFERPDAQQLIQQLYARAAAAVSSPAASLELVELGDFLPETPPDPPSQPPQRSEPHLALVNPVSVQAAHAHSERAQPEQVDAPGWQPERKRQTGVMVMVGVIGFAVIASGAFLTYGRERAAITPQEVEDADSPATAATAGVTEPAGSKKRSEPRQEAKGRPSSKPEVRGAIDRSPGAASVITESTTVADTPPAASVAVAPDKRAWELPDPSWAAALPHIVREPADRRLAVPPMRDASGELVYSRANPDVVPPVAIRPHLPSEPPADYRPDHVMVLDLVITSKGDVDSVRLLTVPRTINDFMIVSAAKAWLFAPAKLNGRTVKYKHRIRFVVP